MISKRAGTRLAERIEMDKKRGGILITTERHIPKEQVEDLGDFKEKLQMELKNTIRESRKLKEKAFEIKETLVKVDAMLANER